MDEQAPMCENYPEELSALVCWPSGNVQRFPSLAKAKTMLMRHHYQYIMMSIEEVREYIGEDCLKWYAKWQFTTEDEVPLWDYLQDIAEEKNPWVSIAPSDTTKVTKASTSAGYLIHHKEIPTFITQKHPKQAKVVAQCLSAFEDDGKGVLDADIEKALNSWRIAGKLTTKQDVGRIFRYYRNDLINGGVLTIRN